MLIERFNFFLLKDKGNNVVNLSNSGIGPISELTMLSKYQNFKTKKIFGFKYEDDLNDLEREINEYLFRHLKMVVLKS